MDSIYQNSSYLKIWIVEFQQFLHKTHMLLGIAYSICQVNYEHGFIIFAVLLNVLLAKIYSTLKCVTGLDLVSI